MNQIKSKQERQIGFIKDCGDSEYQANHGDELDRMWGRGCGDRGETHQNLNESEVKCPLVILPCNVGMHAKQKRNRQ